MKLFLRPKLNRWWHCLTRLHCAGTYTNTDGQVILFCACCEKVFHDSEDPERTTLSAEITEDVPAKLTPRFWGPAASWRLMWGFCPKCNSDAPEIYDCTVCKSYGHVMKGLFPEKVVKERWRTRYIKGY
jgi:hypothetical protein